MFEISCSMEFFFAEIGERAHNPYRSYFFYLNALTLRRDFGFLCVFCTLCSMQRAQRNYLGSSYFSHRTTRLLTIQC